MKKNNIMPTLLDQIPQKTQEALGEKMLLIILRRTLKDLYNSLLKKERDEFDGIGEKDIKALSNFVQKNKTAFKRLITENVLKLQKELKK